MAITQFFFFCSRSSAYRHLFSLPFSVSLFSNRWILQFDRLGQLKAPQCLILAGTRIHCADLIVVRTSLRAADQCPGELLGWNIEISSTHKRKNTTNNDRKDTHQLYFHSLWEKKNWCIQFLTLVILLLTISDFVFSQQTLLHGACFWTPGGFACIHSLLFLAKDISASLPAGRSPRRAEQSLPAPHFPKQSISYASATFIYRPSPQITLPSASPVQTCCILPAWAGTAHFVQLSVLVAPVQLFYISQLLSSWRALPFGWC